ncbi:dUTP diphosphatase [Candidatus Riflebacteria bacterium]
MEKSQNILIQLDEGAILPERASPEAAGYDLYSQEEILLNPGHTLAIKTGVRIVLPANIMGEIRSRSGLALNHSIAVLNSPGTIDPDYRGEIKIILHNFGREPFQVKKHMRVAQLILAPFFSANFKISQITDDTLRGSGGFGHTGLSSD